MSLSNAFVNSPTNHRSGRSCYRIRVVRQPAKVFGWQWQAGIFTDRLSRSDHWQAANANGQGGDWGI